MGKEKEVNLMTALYLACQIQCWKVKDKFRSFMLKESGEVNIIAMIIILAIAISLAIVFKTKINELFTKIWDSLFTKATTDW